MKKIILTMAALVVGGGLSVASAQGTGNNPGNGGPPADPPGPNGDLANFYNWNYSWSNYFNYSNSYAWGENQWWRNGEQQADDPAPKQWQHQKQEIVGPQGRPDDRPKRAQQGERPADVQAMVQQFQQDRQALMKQLKGASDEQRQQVLQQMEQLRTQLREHVASLREQAQQQAQRMRTQFRNNYDPVLNQGANGGGNNNGGRDR